MDSNDIIKLLGALALFTFIIAAIIFGPLVTIWALNLLFGLKIAFTFWTWLATLWITAIFGGAKYFTRKS